MDRWAFFFEISMSKSIVSRATAPARAAKDLLKSPGLQDKGIFVFTNPDDPRDQCPFNYVNWRSSPEIPFWKFPRRDGRRKKVGFQVLWSTKRVTFQRRFCASSGSYHNLSAAAESSSSSFRIWLLLMLCRHVNNTRGLLTFRHTVIGNP